MKHFFLKVLTLSFFVGLIGAFIAYRSGYRIQSSPNGGVLAKPLQDSIKKKINMMSSSKSIVFAEPAAPTLSLSRKNPGPFEKKEPMISSSKSAIIFDKPLHKADSLKAKP